MCFWPNLSSNSELRSVESDAITRKDAWTSTVSTVSDVFIYSSLCQDSSMEKNSKGNLCCVGFVDLFRGVPILSRLSCEFWRECSLYYLVRYSCFWPLV
ncbi:hypothetical protein RHMOL_Rhmol01G0017200 [Rhododendron molle]|uniref:Uncharacterized protein n=1 Tax=Rhododendron molle TaxID=49168 RepID=A0ACC0PXA7_RHOML|nr:hypothetical protein RHMOL_Rhmol01G0017200 [Rhododendron molle]